jgi:hypothetical protein
MGHTHAHDIMMHFLPRIACDRRLEFELDAQQARQRLSLEGHTLVERFSAGAETRLYLDRDAYYDNEPDEEEVSRAEAEVRANVEAMLDVLRTPANDMTYRLATRHGRTVDGRWKLSFRPYVAGMSVRYGDIPKIIAHVGQEKFWDMTVYKAAEQLLAGINGNKSSEDTRVLRPEAPDDDPLDYVAQNVSADWPFLDLPEDFGAEKQGSDYVAEADDDVFLQGLLRLLPHAFADDYDTWIKVGLALKHAGAPYELYREFSKRSSKFDDGACERKWESFRHARNSAIGVGTLCMWAKTADPLAYEKIRAGRRDRDKEAARREAETVPAARGTAEQALVSTRKLVALLRMDAVVTDVLGPAEVVGRVVATRATLSDGKAYRFELGLEDLSVKVREEATDLMLIKTHIHASEAIDVVGHDLAALHKDIKSGQEWALTRPADSKALFTSPSATIEFLNVDRPGSETARLELTDMRKNARLTSKRDIALLSAAMAGAQQAALDRLGLGWAVVGNGNFVNAGTLNVVLDPDAGRNTDVKLVEAVLARNPDLRERIRYAPDVKSQNCNGLYFCDPETNVWSQRVNAVFETLLVERFGSMDLHEKDRRHIESRRGGNDLLYVLGRHVLDERFVDKLNSDLDVFAVDNGVFDTRNKTFRAIRPEDHVSTTAGWSYSTDQAREHRGAVEAFLASVLPVPEERGAVLDYFASLLSGNRTVKKFLVMTDRRSGNNGKSTLAKLFVQFFGRKAKESTKFVCRGAFERDRDSHGAGTETYRGMRLVVAEELKHGMTLDEAMLKRYTGGTDVTVEDRKFGSGEWYKFVWQAGFLLIFNDGDCPKFDAGDEAFVNRMLVAPMRSKFVERPLTEHEEPHTFATDRNIKVKFKAWMSALADVLLARFDPDALADHHIPEAMREWRGDIGAGANPVSAWLEETVTGTGDDGDYVLLADLQPRFAAARPGERVPERTFNRMAKAALRAMEGVVVNDIDHVLADGQWRTKRNVVRGVVMIGV